MFPLAILISYTGVVIITIGNHQKRSQFGGHGTDMLDEGTEPNEYDENSKAADYDPQEPPSIIDNEKDKNPELKPDEADDGEAASGDGEENSSHSQEHEAEDDELSYAVEVEAEPQPSLY